MDNMVWVYSAGEWHAVTRLRQEQDRCAMLTACEYEYMGRLRKDIEFKVATPVDMNGMAGLCRKCHEAASGSARGLWSK